jgi:O-antigen/teichoic acid export membrane protein
MVYGAAGAGFAGANLILARVLPAVEYGIFTLVTALANLSLSLAPVGLDGIVLRRHTVAGPQLLSRVVSVTTVVGLASAAVGALAYDLSPSLLAMLVLSTIAGGAMVVASAQFQSDQRFGLSLALLQSPNVVLLLAALVVVAVHGRDAWLPLLIATAGFIAVGLYGWRILLRERQGKPQETRPIHWGEAIAFAGLQASGLLLIQLDRLVIPNVLPIQDLATFGVLAAIAGSLFRVLQMGVGYTLLPRLRAAVDVPARRRLIAHEVRLVGAIVLLGSAFIWVVTPLIERWFLAGKYHLAGSLVLASIVSGIAKILNSFARATVSALGDAWELTLVNIAGWASVGVAVLAAVFAARWGLVGVIYGVGLGWVLRALAAFYLTMRHLRLPAAVPVTAPGPYPLGVIQKEPFDSAQGSLRK